MHLFFIFGQVQITSIVGYHEQQVMPLDYSCFHITLQYSVKKFVGKLDTRQPITLKSTEHKWELGNEAGNIIPVKVRVFMMSELKGFIQNG